METVPMSQVALGQAIREAREKKGMTLRALATAVGVTAPFLSDLEHGRRRTTLLAEIADVLGVPLQDLEAAEARVDLKIKEWIEQNPGLVALLRESKRLRRPLVLDTKRPYRHNYMGRRP